MAIQTNMYPENLGLPISSQDYFFFENKNNNNFVNNNNNLAYNENNLQYKLLQQQQQQQQCFRYQQQQQLQLQQQLGLRNMEGREGFVYLQPTKKQKLGMATAATTTTAGTTTSTTTIESDNQNFSHKLSAQLQKQGMEIDRFVTLQNEWLRMTLQEQRNQQIGSIIKKLEAKTLELLKQKDEQIEEATKRTIELQQIVQKLEVENQAWQRIALENEALVFSLNNTIEQQQQQQQFQQQRECSSSSSSSSNDVEDAESCYNNVKGETKEVFCKVCKTRNACVLLLPCRHMCCCKNCDGLIDECPVCKSPKKASIHALIS